MEEEGLVEGLGKEMEEVGWEKDLEEKAGGKEVEREKEGREQMEEEKDEEEEKEERGWLPNQFLRCDKNQQPKGYPGCRAISGKLNATEHYLLDLHSLQLHLRRL